MKAKPKPDLLNYYHMENLQTVLSHLNKAQRQAVDTIDGPVLVIAGPGTGKTQLLSARVANILQQTDTLPRNILCLTFTESGAENMRERLTRFIGQSAYDVTISTYHGFGSDIIYRFPQYFTSTQLQNPVDQLGMHQILQAIVDSLSYTNPLKQLRHHIGDLISTISEVKHALLTPEDLRAIATENQRFIVAASNTLAETLDGLTTMPRTIVKAAPIFEAMLAELHKLANRHSSQTAYGSLAVLASTELETALQAAEDTGKTTPLTAWKNNWLAKDADNHYAFDGQLENQRIAALADVFEQYQAALGKRGLYDFDDMIGRVVHALDQHPELRFTLQEQYLYLLLDEFQDTNAAQLRLVQLLTDNPVSEGRPNVMAVGDDDQAIYAFQGAQYSNMLDFYRLYRGVNVINLTENYRSHAHVIQTAEAIADQIDARLQVHFEGMSKHLAAKGGNLPTAATIIRQEFMSDIAQYDWIAHHIRQLIDTGVSPTEIAVLAPKHRYLEPLVAHLNALDIPVQYEKRENILEAPIVKQLLVMCRLVLALNAGNFTLADTLWPQVLSFDFWQIPTKSVWELAWRVSDSKGESNWTQMMLNEASCQTPALLFATLAGKATDESAEIILDYLIGTQPLPVNDPQISEITSPLRDFYTGDGADVTRPTLFYETISHLRVLRAKLREHQAAENHTHTLADLMMFVQMYQDAGEQMLNTSPYSQHAQAVQLMTVFKAKGLEFEHVFLPSCHDDVWGGGSRGSTNRLTLPPNLQPIRHAGATDDERLRILFVAITRAKHGLYLTSFGQTYSGHPTKRLKYLNEQEQPDGSFKALVLPTAHQTIHSNQHEAPSLATLELDWRGAHADGMTTSGLRSLLDARLKNFQLSPTHLIQFLDLEYCGPQEFFFRTILRFPQAPTPNSLYGEAIHETLEWVQHETDRTGQVPTVNTVIEQFKSRLQRKRLTEAQLPLELERGENALKAYLTKRSHIFKPGDRAEYNFRNEGVMIDDVRLGGKVDRMEINTKDKTITVVDYKTGKPAIARDTDTRYHKYKLQLYCYKLLIEHSRTFAGYTVTNGRLEFIEPDQQGSIQALDIPFDAKELTATKSLLKSVWRHLQALDFPDTSAYPKTAKGIAEFETSLRNDS